MATFKDRFKELRTEKGTTQADISKYLDVKPQTVSLYESGREPDYEKLSKMATFFGVSTDYLIGHSDIKKHEDKSIQEIVFEDLPEDFLTKKQMETYMSFQQKIISTLSKSVKFLSSIKDNDDIKRYSDTINDSIESISAITLQYKSGELYWAELSEEKNLQGGLRPVLIIQTDRDNEYNPTVLIAPITAMKDRVNPRTNVLIKDYGNIKDSVIMTDKIMAINKKYIGDRIAKLSADDLIKVKRAIGFSLGTLTE